MKYPLESRALTRTLAPYRTGAQGKLRAETRCLLVLLMGHARCDDIPVGIRKIPPSFSRNSGLAPDEVRDMALVAYDGLLELGYEAAAEELRRTNDPEYIPYRAKEALENLEAGPPSVSFGNRNGGSYPLITKTIRRYTTPRGGQYVIGRCVTDPLWWYRFAVGQSTYSEGGRWTGWDRTNGHTFERRGKTLEDVLAAKYGSEALV